jgi:hypothetical protein
MTNALDSDRMPPKAPESLALPFESSQAEIAGVRLLPAQLARLLGVSKQAVSEWVKAGRVVLGLDGRVCPNKAIVDLMRTGDPRRLRAKLLQPLAADLRARDARIAALEERVAALGLALADANESADFEGESAAGFSAVFAALEERIADVDAWGYLHALPADTAAAVLTAWMGAALECGAAENLTFAWIAGDLAADAARDALEGGDGEEHHPHHLLEKTE